MAEIEIYTDGACAVTTGSGGWAAYLIHKPTGYTKMISGGKQQSTNNEMELMAPIEALKALKRNSTVIVYSDSQYVVNGIMQWSHKWKRAGWKKKGGGIKNLELWKELYKLAHESGHSVRFAWVKGHNGNEYNELVDKEANRISQLGKVQS